MELESMRTIELILLGWHICTSQYLKSKILLNG